MAIKWADEPAEAPKSRIRWEDPPQAVAAPEAPKPSSYEPITGIPRFAAPKPELSAEDKAREKAMADLVAGMSMGEKLVAGIDRGVTRTGQALQQAGLHLDASLRPEADDGMLKTIFKGGARRALGTPGIVPDESVAAYDESLREDRRLWDAGLGKDTTANVGDFVGGAAVTAPLGGGAMGGKLLASTAKQAGAGALGAALTTPADGQGSYLEQKATQAALGGAIGGGINVASYGAGQLAEEASGNLLRRGYNQLVKGANAKPGADEGEALAQKFGIELTPGQVSGGKTQLAAENMARQSIFTREAVFETDMKIADQYADAINKSLDKLAKNGGDAVTAGASIKQSVDDAVDRLSKRRSKLADADFKAVDALAKGAPVIDPANYKQSVARIIEENSVAPKGSDARALADSMNDLLENAGDNGIAANMVKTRRYLSQVAGGQASFAGSAGQPMQKRAAAQLLDALDKDIGVASGKGGSIGEALKLANDRYRAYSQRIEGVKKGPLGKLLGKDLVDEAGSGFSGVAPEQIFDRFSKMSPSHIQVAMKSLSPEATEQVKRAYVQRALETAQQQLASGGAKQASIRPATFVATLQKNPEDKRRIAALFSPDERAELDQLMNLGRRIGDRTGANTSESAVMGQTMGIMEKLRSLSVKGLSEVAGGYLGTKEIAKLMADSGGRKALMELRKLPPASARARELASYLGALAGSRELSSQPDKKTQK